MSTFQLRHYQEESIEKVIKAWETEDRVLLNIPTGSGKCLGRGTPVLMYSGKIKPVEDITPGEWLVGPDGLPRLVKTTCQGFEQLYRVSPNRGDSYVVNASHILSLKITNTKDKVRCGGRSFSSGEIANVNVEDYLNSNRTFRHCAKAWKPNGTDFIYHGIDPDMPPYILGLWLGDGSNSNSFIIHKPDHEIATAVQDYAQSIGMDCKIFHYKKCPQVKVVRPSGVNNNSALDSLRHLGLADGKPKHIPDCYKYSLRRFRWQLLAGLLDSDGHLNRGSFDYISKDRQLAEDVTFLARSLGLHAAISECEKRCQDGFTGRYHRVYISGDCSQIPTRIARKQCLKKKRATNHLMCGIKVEPIGEGEYFGFEIEGADRLFLLGDFTVTHNTTIAAELINRLQPGRVLFLADQNELCTQPLATIAKITGLIPGLEKAQSRASLDQEVAVGSIQTLKNKRRLERFPMSCYDYLIIDEVHRHVKQKEEIMNHFFTAKVLGLTATPFRSTMADLSKWYPAVAHSIRMDAFAEMGFAPKIRVLTLPLEIDISNIGTSMSEDGKDFNQDDTASTIEPYMDAIADMIRTHAPDRHGIIFLPLVRTSIAMAQAMQRHGFSCAHVDSSSPDRSDIIKRFSRGDFKWLCNANLVSTGVDIPAADCFLNLRLTRSKSQYQQSLGRIMRALPGVIDDLPGAHQVAERQARIAASAKPEALVLDLLLQHDRLGVCGPADLIAGNEEERKAIAKALRDGTEQDLLELQKRVQAERESMLAEVLEKTAARHAAQKPITFEEAAYFVGDIELATYEPIEGWELTPASEAQILKLSQWGVDKDSIKSKGHAHKLMDRLVSRMKSGLSTLKQVRMIKRMYGAQIPNPHRLTMAEASSLIDQEIRRKQADRLARAS